MKNLKVVHFTDGGMEHNWKVYTDGFMLGYVHCNGDGEDFGGSLSTSAVHHIEDEETWSEVQALCFDMLADFYLIDRMEAMGY